MRLSVVILLAALFGPAACVTEVQTPAVSIHAGETGAIYPPRELYGTYRSGTRLVIFQRPPAAAVLLGFSNRLAEYDIAALRRNTGGTYTMRLSPRLGGPLVERTFSTPENGRLTEIEGNSEVHWTRRDE